MKIIRNKPHVRDTPMTGARIRMHRYNKRYRLAHLKPWQLDINGWSK